jgi:tetratricopeptide (TPR) repeat protein
MRQLLHKDPSGFAEYGMRRTLICCLTLLAFLGADLQSTPAVGQGYPGGPGQMPGGRGSMSQPGGETSSAPLADKPDAAARKAFSAGVKSLNRARELEEAAEKATNPDKKAAMIDKIGDAYGKALDQFTEVLRNNGNAADAWNNVGYIHLRLGAYNESIDDYNHALAIKADSFEAVAHRGEAYLAVDRLDDAKAAYMYLFNHARPLADLLMASMQKWLESHRAAANGMRAADIGSFGKWVEERDGIAKQTASAAASTPR